MRPPHEPIYIEKALWLVLLVCLLVLLFIFAGCTTAQAQEPDRALVMPTAFYVTASSVDWATAAPACQIGCKSRTGLLPYVSEARVAVPIGLLLDVGVLLLTHKVLAPRWPTLAAGILYALTIVRSVNAADHLIIQRDWNRRTRAGLP